MISKVLHHSLITTVLRVAPSYLSDVATYARAVNMVIFYTSLTCIIDEIHSDVQTALPWAIHTSNENIAITDG